MATSVTTLEHQYQTKPKPIPMSSDSSAGQRFRQALADENPLQIVGAINAYCGLMAEQTGFRAIYLSGAGVANALSLIHI